MGDRRRLFATEIIFYIIVQDAMQESHSLFVKLNVCMRLFQGFYQEVANPLLSEVDLRYPDNAVDSLTTNHYTQLYNGSEIVVAGRLMDNDLDNFIVEVFGQGVRRRSARNGDNAELARRRVFI